MLFFCFICVSPKSFVREGLATTTGHTSGTMPGRSIEGLRDIRVPDLAAPPRKKLLRNFNVAGTLNVDFANKILRSYVAADSKYIL